MAEERIPPPPPIKRGSVPMARTGSGKIGEKINLLVNHFKVSVNVPDAVFYGYSVSIKYGDDKTIINGKGTRRRVMDKLHRTYSSEMGGNVFAYDGEKALYTIAPLPQENSHFIIVLEEASVMRNTNPATTTQTPEAEADPKRSKRFFQSKAFNVQISFATTIPLRDLEGIEAQNTTGDALRVINTILRQQAAKRGCLLVRQSFFHDDVRNFVDVGGGVTACRGFHSSFRTTQGGLSLNMDVSSTMILTPGPVLNFILTNQGVEDPRNIDWGRAKKMLKNLRLKATHNNMEFKIIGISDKPCNEQYFPLKIRSGNGTEETVEVTVYNYFTQKRKIELSNSAYMPCLDVGKPKRPNYLPLELCSLVSLQRYTKALSSMQRALLVERSRRKPQECIQSVTNAVRNYRYDDDPMLKACGISIEKQLISVEGRVLHAPMLMVGNRESCIPRNGHWELNQKMLFSPTKIDHWAVVNFSAQCDLNHLCKELAKCGRHKGIHISPPHSMLTEDPKWRKSGPLVRVERMFENLLAVLPGAPKFLLCVLPEKKKCDIYGPWKKKNLHEYGIVTQCISPTKIHDQYLLNVLLKINSKLRGINSVLALEKIQIFPVLKNIPTMIFGMDVSHGSPGQSDIPSIAAVVGSRYWPLISRYRGSVRTQSPKVEMIESLFKLLPNGEDDGIIRELLVEFYQSSKCKPQQIIIFRDGISESQFNQVLNIELEQIIKAIEHLGVDSLPKFTLIVAQKNHHTKLFLTSGLNNVPPGTVVDSQIVHPHKYDFFMCAHNGAIGTSRPTHYHVLLDEIGFETNDLQNFIHSLSYINQRSTNANSIVAPISYAHLAAAQMSQFLKFEDSCSNSSKSQEITAAGPVLVPQLPRLHKKVESSMFFC